LSNLFADSIFQLISPTNLPNNDLSFQSSYYDYYYYSKPNGEKQYFNSSYFQLQTKHKELSAFVNYSPTRIFVNNIDALSDNIDLIKKSYSFGLKYQFWQGTFQKNRYELNCEISSLIWRIYSEQVLFYNRWTCRNFQLSFSPIWSRNTDNGFDNKAGGYTCGLAFNPQIKNILLSNQIDYGNISALLKYGEDVYCEINNLQYLHFISSMEYSINKNNRIKAGITGIKTWQAEKGFIDVEPFFGIWSLFFGSKTFIKKIDVELILPFMDYEANFNIGKLQNHFNIDYYHIFFQSNIIYTERKWIAGIIPNDKTQHELDVTPNIDGLFKLEFSLGYNFEKLHLQVNIRQILPIKFSKLEQSVTDTSKIKQRGGTNISTIISYTF